VYIPPQFQERRVEVLHELMRRYSFGALVSMQGGEMVVSHLPFLLAGERGEHGTLRGHMARANPQWQSFMEEQEVLAIFEGPHAYISPSWYEDAVSVPTWNYAVVHAHGVPRLIEDDDELYQLLDDLVRMHEASMENPWRFDLPADYVRRMMKGIVGFEIRLTRLEGKLKLNQNRSLSDQQAVVDALQRQGDDLSVGVAELMAVAAGIDTPAPAQKRSVTKDE
jgi:transcriptional regulator